MWTLGSKPLVGGKHRDSPTSLYTQNLMPYEIKEVWIDENLRAKIVETTCDKQ